MPARYARVRDRSRTLVAADDDERPAIGPFVYVRFHGATGKYGGSYPDDRLRSWAEWLAAERRTGADVYAYFNNDVGGHAPRNALTLRGFLEEQG